VSIALIFLFISVSHVSVSARHTLNNTNIIYTRWISLVLEYESSMFLNLNWVLGWGKGGEVHTYGFVPFGRRSKCCRPHLYRDYISLAMEALLPLALYLAYACSVRSALSWVSVRSTWALRNLLRLIAAISSASSICFL